jgi:hypothetical protein
VLELQSVRTNVVGCYARPAALDTLLTGFEGRMVRVAPNELLVLSNRSHLGELEKELGALDSTSVVLDLSSSFAVWSLRGDDRYEAFCRLSELNLDGVPKVAQGLVAGLPAKVLIQDGELVVLVSSAVRHHVRERVLNACADLAPVEVVAEAAAGEAAQLTAEEAALT